MSVVSPEFEVVLDCYGSDEGIREGTVMPLLRKVNKLRPSASQKASGLATTAKTLRAAV